MNNGFPSTVLCCMRGWDYLREVRGKERRREVVEGRRDGGRKKSGREFWGCPGVVPVGDEGGRGVSRPHNTCLSHPSGFGSPVLRPLPVPPAVKTRPKIADGGVGGQGGRGSRSPTHFESSGSVCPHHSL